MRFGVLTIPVEDRSPALKTPEALRHELSEEAYFFRIRALEAAGLPKPRQMTLYPNKFHSEEPDVQHLDGERKTALMFRRIAQIGGRDDGLYLRRDNPGFRETFRSLPRSFEDVAETIFTQRVQGGNGTNLVIDGLVEGASLGDARGDLRFDVVSPNHNAVAEFVREQATRYPGLAELHEVQDIRSRVSYHVDHRILHEGKTDTLMISSPPTPEEAINEALARSRGVIESSDLFIATDDYAGLRGTNVGLVPSSNVMKKLSLRPGQVLLVNDGELLSIFNNGFNGPRDTDPSMPDVVGGDGHALALTNNLLRRLLLQVAPYKVRGRERVASIGKRGGGSLGFFREGMRGYAVEVTLPSAEASESMVRDADSPHIAMHTTGGVGRGDASASALVFDDIPLASFMHLLREEGMETPHGLSEEQMRLASMLIPELAGRLNSTLVHFSYESNFGHLDPRTYRSLLLKYAVRPALRCALQTRGDLQEHPQTFECSETGFKAAAWVVV